MSRLYPTCAAISAWLAGANTASGSAVLGAVNTVLAGVFVALAWAREGRAQ